MLMNVLSRLENNCRSKPCISRSTILYNFYPKSWQLTTTTENRKTENENRRTSIVVHTHHLRERNKKTKALDDIAYETGQNSCIGSSYIQMLWRISFAPSRKQSSTFSSISANGVQIFCEKQC
jgi:hypothetical protein